MFLGMQTAFFLFLKFFCFFCFLCFCFFGFFKKSLSHKQKKQKKQKISWPPPLITKLIRKSENVNKKRPNNVNVSNKLKQTVNE